MNDLNRACLLNLAKATQFIRLAWWMKRRGRLNDEGRRFHEFRRKYGKAISHDLKPEKTRTALICSCENAGIETELGLLKGLEMAGFNPLVLTGLNEWYFRYYRLAGYTVYFPEEFPVADYSPAAEIYMEDVQSNQDMLAIHWWGSDVGRHALATAMRWMRVGSFDYASERTRTLLRQFLAASIQAAVRAHRILDWLQPQFALFVGGSYTPAGELFEVARFRGIDVVTWNAGHKHSTIMFKRHSLNAK